MNRIIRVGQDGLKYEADPRHVELLAASLGLTGCSPVKTPGVKPASVELEAPKGNEGSVTGDVIDVQGNVFTVGAAQATTAAVISATMQSSDNSTPAEGTKNMNGASVGRTLQCVSNDASLDLPINDVSLSACQNSSEKHGKFVKFDLGKTEIYDITPYAESYLWHPRKFVITKHGIENVPHRSDPFTGMSSDVMTARKSKLKAIQIKMA